MAALKELHAKLVGSPIASNWAQVATLSSPNDPDSRLGKLNIVIQITRTDEEEAAFFGKHLIDQVQNAYFAKETDTIFAALNRSLQTVKELFSREGQKILDPTFLAIVIDNDRAYAGKVGRGLIALFRENVLSPLLSQTQTLGTISGVVKRNDYIILGTENFYEHAYPTDELFDSKNTPQDIVDILSPVLLSLPQNADIAAYIVAFKEDERETTTKPADDEDVGAKAGLLLAPATGRHPLEQAIEQQSKKPKLLSGVTQVYQSARPVLYALAKQARVGGLISRRRKLLGAMQQPTEAAKHHVNLVPKRFKRLFVIAVVIVIVGFASVWVSLQIARKRQEAKVSQAYALANKNLAVAQSIKSQDPKRAKELLDQASQAVAQAKDKHTKVKEPEGLADTIRQELSLLTENDRITNPTVFFDMTFVKEGFSATKFVPSQASFVVVDTKAPTVVRLAREKKTGTIATGGDKVKGLQSATFLGDTILAVTPDGVFRIDEGSGNAEKVIAKEDVWGTISDIATFNDNIYLLDQANKQVWKYVKEGTGYQKAKNLIEDSDKASFFSGNDMVIDGVIWVAGEGTIARINNGKVQKFTITGLSDLLGNYLRLSTSTDAKELYVLDKDKQRIVVTGKDGKFIREYKSQSFSNVVDIAADVTNKQLYLLTENKILTIPLQ